MESLLYFYFQMLYIRWQLFLLWKSERPHPKIFGDNYTINDFISILPFLLFAFLKLNTVCINCINIHNIYIYTHTHTYIYTHTCSLYFSPVNVLTGSEFLNSVETEYQHCRNLVPNFCWRQPNWVLWNIQQHQWSQSTRCQQNIRTSSVLHILLIPR